MSPTAKTSKNKPYPETPEAMLRRRREQQTEDAADLAGTSMEPMTAETAPGLELIGQELVPASEALVLVPEGPVVVPQEVRASEPAAVVESSVKEEGFQTPMDGGRKGRKKSPVVSSAGQGVWQGNGMDGAASSNRDARELVLPTGPPVSFQPSQTPLPLFTPEQIATAAVQMQEAQSRSSLLFPREGRVEGSMGWHGVGEIPHGHGQFAFGHPGFDSGQLGFGDHQQRERHWKMEMERIMSSLGLQLRASQHENQRLRMEIQDLKDKQEPSNYGTPEEKVLANLGGKKEDGTRIQQALEDLRKEEDGAGAQQEEEESSEEDGLGSQQEEEEEGMEELPGRNESPKTEARGSQGKRKPARKSSADPTIQVLLELVEGIQEMHKRIDDNKGGYVKEAEVVRHSPEIPKLQEWCSDTAPIDFNDWLLCLGPPMSDLSQSSEQWWEETLKAARRWYEKHMALTPIERLTHKAVATPGMTKAKWSRVEHRAASLLLAAVPESLKEEVISSKEVTTLAILTRGMCVYQPGGLSERVAVLGALESPPEAPTINAAISSLRRWLRWKRRAAEIGVNPPDATILAKGLAKLTKRILATYPDLHFRLSLTRSTLMIDTIPSQESVGRYAEHVLAELEQLGHQVRKKEIPQQEVQPKIKKFEEGSKGRRKRKERKVGRRRRKQEDPMPILLDRPWMQQGQGVFVWSCPGW